MEDLITRFIPHSVLSAHVIVNTSRVLETVKIKTQRDSAEYIRCDFDLPLEGDNFNHIKLVNSRCDYDVLEGVANSFSIKSIWSDDSDEYDKPVLLTEAQVDDRYWAMRRRMESSVS